jgi:NADPH:quinone reductase-like Zn-dependent oxidoreductase
MRGYYLEKLDLPSRIGYEASGIVEAVGPDVDWQTRRNSPEFFVE